ncbi:60S ribosomal protein L7a [Sciurus carolinensis]|uniref:60S ribosomal protein L7a n=1 Tax=Sciurus carolinensis TaxID=30640 RepID=A0AA41MZB1_SCICA|nr:60S ribosomal protein L7a [Sciurus carolinensis]
MPKGKKAKGKKVVPAPAVVKKQEAKKVTNPLFKKRPKNFGIGQVIQPKRDLTRFVKWPRYIWLQRQRAILYKRFKVPPALTSSPRPWTPEWPPSCSSWPTSTDQRPGRRRSTGCWQGGRPHKETTSPSSRGQYRHHLGREQEGSAVVTAHDVDPIELAVFLPALCRKMGVPSCVVKGKARLGRLVHRKTCTVHHGCLHTGELGRQRSSG